MCDFQCLLHITVKILFSLAQIPACTAPGSAPAIAFQTRAEKIYCDLTLHICWAALSAGVFGLCGAAGRLLKQDAPTTITQPVCFSLTCFSLFLSPRPLSRCAPPVAGGSLSHTFPSRHAIQVVTPRCSRTPPITSRDLLSIVQPSPAFPHLISSLLCLPLPLNHHPSS